MSELLSNDDCHCCTLVLLTTSTIGCACSMVGDIGYSLPIHGRAYWTNGLDHVGADIHGLFFLSDAMHSWIASEVQNERLGFGALSLK